jgi:hypothetical protein
MELRPVGWRLGRRRLMFARFSTLLLAGMLASPALWQAFVTHDLDVSTALTRYLIAVLVAAVMLALLRMVVRAHHEAQDRHNREAELERVRVEAQQRIEERRKANQSGEEAS